MASSIPNRNNFQRDLFDNSDQSGPGSNGDEGPNSLELELHHQMQFNVLPRTLFWVVMEVYSLSVCILSPANRATKTVMSIL